MKYHIIVNKVFLVNSNKTHLKKQTKPTRVKVVKPCPEELCFKVVSPSRCCDFGGSELNSFW